MARSFARRSVRRCRAFSLGIASALAAALAPPGAPAEGTRAHNCVYVRALLWECARSHARVFTSGCCAAGVGAEGWGKAVGAMAQWWRGWGLQLRSDGVSWRTAAAALLRQGWEHGKDKSLPGSMCRGGGRLMRHKSLGLPSQEASPGLVRYLRNTSGAVAIHHGARLLTCVPVHAWVCPNARTRTHSMCVSVCTHTHTLQSHRRRCEDALVCPSWAVRDAHVAARGCPFANSLP